MLSEEQLFAVGCQGDHECHCWGWELHGCNFGGGFLVFFVCLFVLLCFGKEMVVKFLGLRRMLWGNHLWEVINGNHQGDLCVQRFVLLPAAVCR